jgi:hypothetical protein
MLDTEERFSLRYRGELREALIMIEGDDGGFTLLTHGTLTDERPWALVRSSTTGRSFVLVRASPQDNAVARWREASGTGLGPDVVETAAENGAASAKRIATAAH